MQMYLIFLCIHNNLQKENEDLKMILDTKVYILFTQNMKNSRYMARPRDLH